MRRVVTADLGGRLARPHFGHFSHESARPARPSSGAWQCGHGYDAM
jgi:hypothetical protein